MRSASLEDSRNLESRGCQISRHGKDESLHPSRFHLRNILSDLWERLVGGGLRGSLSLLLSSTPDFSIEWRCVTLIFQPLPLFYVCISPMFQLLSVFLWDTDG
jgi:hypothetical protein